MQLFLNFCLLAVNSDLDSLSCIGVLLRAGMSVCQPVRNYLCEKPDPRPPSIIGKGSNRVS